MKSDILKLFNLQRQIFGICPHSGEIFRLSDCKIFLRKKPQEDWLDKIERKEIKLYEAEEKLRDKEEELREKAREKGRKLALQTVRKIDGVFTPRKLNPDDAKVLFHPIDYVVFNGMKDSDSIKNIILLDRTAKENRVTQRSIEKTIERGNYEWQTLRIEANGKIKIE